MNKRLLRILLLIVAMILLALPLPQVTGVVLSRDVEAAPREIHLLVRDMAYYLDGNPNPNPTLHVEAGQRVRLIFDNQDVGVTHDLQIPALDLSIRLLKGKASETVDVTVPDRRGQHPYKCTIHAALMQGIVTVE